MKQIEDLERHLVLNNYKTLDNQQLSYYYNKFNKRLESLHPLLNELETKKISLHNICKPLAQEVLELTELIKFLQQFKK